MPQFNTYLTFDGNCAEAMRFYEKALGGKLDLMTNGQSPVAGQIPAENNERVMHARLVFEGGTLMASDALIGMGFSGMKGFALTLTYDTASEARRMFDTLGEGGKVGMPFEKTFWAEGFGMLTDRFGTPWIINGGMTAA